MIKFAFQLTLALFIFGSGSYVGWQANSTYTQATADPLGFALKVAGMGGK